MPTPVTGSWCCLWTGGTVLIRTTPNRLRSAWRHDAGGRTGPVHVCVGLLHLQAERSWPVPVRGVALGVGGGAHWEAAAGEPRWLLAVAGWWPLTCEKRAPLVGMGQVRSGAEGWCAPALLSLSLEPPGLVALPWPRTGASRLRRVPRQSRRPAGRRGVECWTSTVRRVAPAWVVVTAAWW